MERQARVNIVLDAILFILDPTNWLGTNGIAERLWQHLAYTGLSVGIALVIAVPLGLIIGHTGRGRRIVVVTTNAARALPTFGLLLFLVLIFGLGLWPLIVVLVIMAVPPILAGVYAGVESVDRQTVDAARAIGMTELQIVARVEVPLALPLFVGGLRSAVLQVVATATIAGYVAGGALGRYLIEGLAVRDYARTIVGALLVTALALLAEAILAIAQRLAVPRGVPRGTARFTRTTLARPSGLSEHGAPVTKGISA